MMFNHPLDGPISENPREDALFRNVVIDLHGSQTVATYRHKYAVGARLRKMLDDPNELQRPEDRAAAMALVGHIYETTGSLIAVMKLEEALAEAEAQAD